MHPHPLLRKLLAEALQRSQHIRACSCDLLQNCWNQRFLLSPCMSLYSSCYNCLLLSSLDAEAGVGRVLTRLELFVKMQNKTKKRERESLFGLQHFLWGIL